MKKTLSPLRTTPKTWKPEPNPTKPERRRIKERNGAERKAAETRTVTGVLLLAGCSSRMGSPKPLLTFGDQTLAARMLSRIILSDLDRLVVVLGYQAKEIKKEILKSSLSARVKIIINPEFRQGLSTSIKSALSRMEPGTSGIMFLMGDQPLLTTEVINKLLTIFRSTSAPIVVPLYGKRPGNPVIFRETLIPELQNLSGDIGGRMLIKKYWNQVRTVSIRPQRIGWDMDTWEEYKKIKEAGL